MELSSLVSRQIPYLSGGAGINTRSSQPLFPGDVHFQGRKAFGASRLRSRRALNSGFGDNGHVEYYNSGSTSAAGNHKKVKEIKKKLKLLEGLAEGLAAQLQGNPISDSAEALLQQLEQVRAEEKELKKKKKKLEKANLKIKSVLMKITNDGDDESSESGEGVTDTNNGVGLDALNNALGLAINIGIQAGDLPDSAEE